MITVRRAEPTDYEGIWRTFQDPGAVAGTLQLPFPSREAWRKRLAETPEGHYILVAEIDGEIVGHAGLHPVGTTPRRAHAMALGIVVRDSARGKGVGSALMAAVVELADKWLNVTRIELTVFTDNERAIALYRKFGFEVEGTHRAYALRDGAYADTHFMARIRRKIE